MAWMKRTAVGLVVAVLLAGTGAAVYVQRSFAVVDGKLRVVGLRDVVRVQRDGADVAHIRAQTPQDVWFAMGFVHAQERTWQLEFNRRVMHGQLSEVFGEATVETDKLLRSLDIMGVARRQYNGLPLYAKEALQAYSQGIHAFHKDRPQALSPEFHVLGVKPGGEVGAVWEPEDSVGWALMMALDLGGNWGNEFARLSVAKTLDTDRLWQLMPPYPGEPPAASADLAALYRQLGVYRANGSGTSAAVPELGDVVAQTSTDIAHREGPLSRQISSGMLAWSDELTRNAGTNDGKGSNNWVLAGTRTVSGKPLLANDPHLGLSAPAIWYFAGMQSPAGKASDGTPIAAIDAVGATLPGLPFVVLGRTDRVAWGFTNTGPDVQDLYLEQINPADASQYRTPDGWAPFTVRTETIRVKGAADVVLQARSTRHGPVLSDAQKSHADVLDLGKYVLALRWSALDADNQTVLAGLQTNQAKSVDELFQALSHYHSPMQSVVAADDQGNVRFKAVGRVPLRDAANDIRGVAPSPGWDARYDWKGWLPYDQTPQDDGARGWIATANQRITAPGYSHYLTQDWALPYRYERIAQLIEATEKHDAQSMQAIHSDVTSLATRRLLPHLLQAQSAHPLAAAAQAQLKGFDGVMDAQRSAPLVFAAWTDELARGLIIPRIGEERFAATYGKRDYRAGIEGMLERNDTWWCQPTSCTDQSAAALGRALDRLQAAYGADPAQWRWGAAHPALSAHRPFGNVTALARFFDVSVPSHGDSYTINVGQYNAGEAKGPFVNRHAASLRAVYDLADLEQSRFIYQTGQSGLVFSPRYRDMSTTWAQTGYRALQRQPSGWVHELTLAPATP
ncbi:MAG: penicillin acylase family protein [Gammaproteobacteria bacterium]|nr:penicillin acylase family protein [Gammaproteobacteria bacterium]MBU1508557.1 penicillin acylase family protein [Gammaproteobacteria bacterium]MBU2119682.1 penicillin acylase family protein [Gammaproteobacteria bacterium]MBU2169112.1 penicillin acylase family protein [Gammaproteobacteria bacterium]MBU2202277.1 penicillin acylase family protein [Gammaproteobacteria bacterium]